MDAVSAVMNGSEIRISDSGLPDSAAHGVVSNNGNVPSHWLEAGGPTPGCWRALLPQAPMGEPPSASS